MAGTSLEGVPHSLEYTQTGDEHVCKVRVTMPNNSVQSFEASCATKHAARVIASFKAACAVRCARDLADADLQDEEPPAPAPAPAPEQRAEASRDSSPKPLDVDSPDSEPQNEEANLVEDPPLDQYSSSAEDDDDDELCVGRRRNAVHAPIAFVPAPDRTAKKPVNSDRNDAPQIPIDENSSVGRSSLGKAKSQHEDEVLDAAPLQERFRESFDVEEGERIEPVTKNLTDTVDSRHLTPRKRKHSSGLSSHPAAREMLPMPRDVPATTQRRTKPFRVERVSASRGQDTGKCKLQTGKTILKRATNMGSNLPSSTENGIDTQEEPGGIKDVTRHENGDNEQPYQKNETYNTYNRIRRVPRKESHSPKPELDATQSHEYPYTSVYQHQPAPPGPLPHPPNPGQIHNSAPYGVHAMFPGTAPHHMSYAAQYPAPHISHPPPPHMAGPYPPPIGSYGAPPGYVTPPGFPPSMMAHAMGGYPYQHPLPNGTSAYYHPHTRGSYPGPQLQESRKVQREAEIRATAAEVAAKMAAEAAAKDAARNAKSDFEANQKAKQDRDDEGGTAQENDKSGTKGDEPLLPNSNQKSNHEGQSGSATADQSNAGRRKSGGNETAVTSIPADDGDQEDYVSILNAMSQKGKMCTNLSTPTFVTVRGENGSRCGQQCTMSVRFIPDPEKEAILITKTVMATRKRKAKQLAAKEILAEIDTRLEAQQHSPDEEVRSKEKGAKAIPQNKSTGITTAVAALHRLYSLNVLCGPPIFRPEEPSGEIDKGVWRSVVFLDVKDFGKHTFEEFGSSKKTAKQKCSLKAFEALKEMKVPGLESFVNISSDGKDPEKGKDVDLGLDQEDAAPIDAIVDTSDDDKGSKSSADAELVESDHRLLLPKDYRLLFPENEFECEQWFKENSKPGSHFGLFVDSPRARAAFTTPTTEKPQEGPMDQPLQPRFLCLSTATSGIVICFPERAEGGMDSESTDDSNASLPEVVVEVLEDPNTKKWGFAVEDGMSVLEHEEDIWVKSVDDVAVVSLAITGAETVRRSGPLASLPELAKHWLRKEVGKISVKGAWRERSDIPIKLPKEGGKEIITGVLASYACFCISKQMRQAARQKRNRTHGVAVAFLQLSEQVMSSAPA